MPPSDTLLRLSDLSRHLQIPLRTIRNKIDAGLIKPRIKYGVKFYSVNEVKKVFGR